MTTITALPTPPTRDDPINFADRADTFLAALPIFATETNAVAAEINTKHNEVMTAEIIAENLRGQWVTATLYSLKDVYTDNGIAYLVVVNHTSTSISSDAASGKVKVYQGVLFSDLALSSGSTLVGYTQGASGSATRTTAQKHQEIVSVADFSGYDSTGVTSSVTAITAALAASKHVIVPAGHTPLIDSTITVPDGKTLEFKGAPGNPAVNPGSYFIKKSTMTTAGIILNECSTLINGGIVGQVGNTGDGIVLVRNASKAIRPFVSRAGGVGIRIGTSATDNSNNTELYHPVTVNNGSHGIYVHDGAANDANAGTIIQPTCVTNGGDGIRLGHAYWVTILNGNCEFNTGWGLYLSGISNAGYPECQYPNIIGGDYNEGNVAGQIYDGSYFASIVNADNNSIPTTAPTGIQGGGLRNALSPRSNLLQGLTTATYPLNATMGAFAGVTTPVIVSNGTLGNGGDGTGILFRPTQGGTPRDAAQIGTNFLGAGMDGLDLYVNKSSVLTKFLALDPTTSSVAPGADNTTSFGTASKRISTVYAATGTINTSDERFKDCIQDIDSAAIRAVKKVNFKQFKFKEAIFEKGQEARWHFGVIAQQVKEAFESEGLNPFEYGVLCYDKWGDKFESIYNTREITSEDGSITTETYDTGAKKQTVVAGEKYGVRYEELLCLRMASI